MKHQKQTLRVYHPRKEAMRSRLEALVDGITMAVSGLGILTAAAFLLTM